MDFHRPKYPYRLYVAGTEAFNNYFLFRHYLNEYKTDKTFLYAPKSSTFDIMSRLYATMNNLCYLSCNVQKGMDRYHNSSALNFKIADVTDMLVVFWDGQSEGIAGLKAAFDSKRKKVIVIDINNSDIITPSQALSIPYTKKATIKEVFGDTIFYQSNFNTNSTIELAMKFLADAYRSKDLMKLVIDNRTTEFTINDKLDEAIVSMLTWIYNNQFAELQTDYQNMIEKELPIKTKRFSPDEYRHAPKCEWQEDGEDVDVYTGTGLLLSHGYTRAIDFGQHTYIEINDAKIVKEHIHKSLKSRALTSEEDNCVKITYRTSDMESYPVTYQVANFETSQFRMGYWYINSQFVTTVKPQPKKEVKLDE